MTTLKQLDALARAIRNEYSVPSPERSDAPDPRVNVCPYRGLEPFREEDAPFFLGRERFIDGLVRKVQDQIHARSPVAVVGRSGSGKSSLVYAGLLPHLRRAEDHVWGILTLRPGDAPLAALAVALAPPPPELDLIQRRTRVNANAEALRRGQISVAELASDILARDVGTDRLLIYVDQWEELYTQNDTGANVGSRTPRIQKTIRVDREELDAHHRKRAIEKTVSLNAGEIAAALSRWRTQPITESETEAKTVERHEPTGRLSKVPTRGVELRTEERTKNRGPVFGLVIGFAVVGACILVFV